MHQHLVGYDCNCTPDISNAGCFIPAFKDRYVNFHGWLTLNENAWCEVVLNCHRQTLAKFNPWGFVVALRYRKSNKSLACHTQPMLLWLLAWPMLFWRAWCFPNDFCFPITYLKPTNDPKKFVFFFNICYNPASKIVGFVCLAYFGVSFLQVPGATCPLPWCDLV